MLPTKFQVNWPIGSEEVAKYRFSRWRPSWIPIGMIWQFLILQVILMLPTQFESTGLMVQKKKKKRIFKIHHGGHLGFPIGPILAFFFFFFFFFIYKSPRCFLRRFTSKGISVREKKRLSRLRPSWISIRNDFSYF